MRRPVSVLTRIMNEVVDYGGLLVVRCDMYNDLIAKGVIVTGKACPAAFAYMQRPAMDAAPEWDLIDGAFHSRLTGQVIA